MIFQCANLAFRNLFLPETRAIFWKVLALTVGALAVIWFAVRGLFIAYLWPWVADLFSGLPDWAGPFEIIAAVFAGIALALGLAFLISPITALIAGVFLDDVAEHIEKRDYPRDPPGTALPWAASLWGSVRFLGVVVLGNLIALLLLLIPGINLIAFFIVNGYLLGREFFEFAAMRFMSPQEARLFRHRYRSTVFAAGLIIALFLAIPFLNLLTPLFAAGMMVHLYKALSRQRDGQGGNVAFRSDTAL